jgi:hypothetical protein
VTRKMALGFVIFLVVCAAAYLRLRRPKPILGTAYVGSHELTLYDSSAQVRAPVGTANFGEQVTILERFGDQVQVRTPAGLSGWTTDSNLLTEEFWKQEQELQAKTATMLVESQGHTRVISNLHIEPGRDTQRVRQLAKGVSVEFFERQPVEVPASVTGAQPAPAANAAPGANAPAAAASAKEADDDDKSSPEANGSSTAPAGPKKEDWWLVRAHLPDQSTLSGWLLGRFIDLDVPQPLPDYANTAGMRIVAWFELNRVPDATGQARPQYLLAGTRDAEGHACDFTMMRVYTWGKQSNRYETAFVQSDLCGKLPVKVTRGAGSAPDVMFAFTDFGDTASAPRTYRMHQTIVRRTDLENARRKANP